MKKNIIILFMLITFLLPNIACLAATESYMQMPNPFKFILDGKNNSEGMQGHVDDAMGTVAPTIYAILLKAGIAIALVVITVWGLMWITAAPNKKAELKASIMPILVGLFILIAGVKPAIMLAEFMQNILITDKTLIAQVEDGAGQIAGLIQALGISIALIIILITGIQWLSANAAKKAELKGKLVSISIGVGIIVLSSMILSWVVNFFYDIKW